MKLCVWWWLVVVTAMAAPTVVAAQESAAAESVAQEPAVRAILFYSPTCPHCGDVINEGLPPILDRYGEQLQIAGVNTASPGGEQLYRAAIEYLAIPPERLGVPTLIVGSTVLVGGLEIPGRLPGIVEAALADTGIDWPEVPLIRQVLEAQGLAPRREVASQTGTAAPPPEPAQEPAANPAATEPEPGTDTAAAAVAAPAEPESRPAPEPQPPPRTEPATDATTGETPPETATGTGAEALPDGMSDETLAGTIDPDARAALVHQLSVTDRLMLDPAGNGTAIAVLILMLAALVVVGADVVGGRIRIPPAPEWAIPVLAVIGLGVAAYLAFVEVTGTAAVCGPVGDCNTVQQSPYARILGVPVGVLGVVGYIVILGVWLAARVGAGAVEASARDALWWLALVATVFSVYLTTLEPFVIGASCAWCLTSALVATLILLAATPRRGVGAPERDVGVSPTRRPSVSH